MSNVATAAPVSNHWLDACKHPYFDKEIAKKAEKENSTVGAMLVNLCKIGVISTTWLDEQEILREIRKILIENRIAFYERKGLLWLRTLETGLNEIFQAIKN